jgi:transcriptional regulator with XRE-family HTH domain
MEAFAISKQLRRRRSELGLSLSEVARRVGTSTATLCRYEKGWERFGLNTLRKLAVALDCEVSVNLTPRSKPTTKPQSARTVRQLRRLFWDRRLQEKDLTAHPVWVVERVLEYGQLADVHLLMQVLGHERFMECVSQARFGCRRTAGFWQSILAQEGRSCTRKFSRNTAWTC